MSSTIPHDRITGPQVLSVQSVPSQEPDVGGKEEKDPPSIHTAGAAPPTSALLATRLPWVSSPNYHPALQRLARILKMTPTDGLPTSQEMKVQEIHMLGAHADPP